MNTEDLLRVSRSAIRGLVPDAVCAVAVGWNVEQSHLTLRYYCDSEITEAVADSCSEALTEIDAAFWQVIKTCSDECVYVEMGMEAPDPLDGFVYMRAEAMR